MRITIASIDMKPSRCLVHTTEGKKYGVWNDKVGKWGLEAGGTYDVEIETNEVNGRNLTNITSAKRLADAMPIASRSPVQGAPPAAAPFRTPEQMFVSDLVVAYIGSGRCPPEGLTKTIDYIRKAWRETFGSNDAYPYEQAAE